MPAHPRSRGENTASFFGSADTLGSSPLTRGKLNVVGISRHHLGLIPAHAGKTRETAFLTGATTAHPRSRGENPRPQPRTQGPTGSSPLTRGKLICQSNLASRSGLIPAHAGKTLAVRPVVGASGAHPRSRGENSTTSQP